MKIKLTNINLRKDEIYADIYFSEIGLTIEQVYFSPTTKNVWMENSYDEPYYFDDKMSEKLEQLILPKLMSLIPPESIELELEI
jgi:hypothetical protein